jgi:membrane protein
MDEHDADRRRTGAAVATGSERDSLLTRVRSRAGRRWAAANARYRWLGHAVAAWNRFRDNKGNHFAGALTYFSFLALFPLVLLAASVLGFVLRNNPELQNDLYDKVTSGLPGGFGQIVHDSIKAAERQRTGVGIVGLAGVLVAGLGWVGNLRAAVNAVWGVEPPKRRFVIAKLADLIVLVGLGIAILVSVGLSAIGTAFTGEIVRAADLNGVSGVHTLVSIAGYLLAVIGDVLIFSWVLGRLPEARAPARIVFRGALLAAVGFGLLKVIGTYYIARVAHSPTVGAFGSIIGVLVWIDLVSRYLLYCAAWTASAVPPSPEPASPERLPPEPAPIVPMSAPEPGPPARPAMSLLRVATSLFGAGVAVGGGAVAALTAHRRRRCADG